MEIIRDEKKYELTANELFIAYQEQEALFDYQNIENNMSFYLSEEEYDLLSENEAFIQAAAEALRRNQDKYDMDFENAMCDAFKTTKKKYLVGI